MGKYYCDYCDIYLTHDSMNARKAHNTGRNHIANVRDYFASLNHDKAQNIIDQIIQSHETGGRNQMMMAPSMRLGAGFMNPMTTQPGGFPSYPPQGGQGQGPPFRPPNQSFNHNGPPNGGPPPSFRPPFPPQHQNGFPPPNINPGMGTPPFPPPGVGVGVGAGNGTPPSFPPGFPGAGGPGAGPNGLPFRPPPISIQNSPAAPNGAGAGPGSLASAPPPAFTQASAPPMPSAAAGGAAPGIHPDRLRMMGNR
ncbi:hypothetical protein IAU59_006896 [Kwoniella sp. CBS 9459]